MGSFHEKRRYNVDGFMTCPRICRDLEVEYKLCQGCGNLCIYSLYSKLSIELHMALQSHFDSLGFLLDLQSAAKDMMWQIATLDALYDARVPTRDVVSL